MRWNVFWFLYLLKMRQKKQYVELDNIHILSMDHREKVKFSNHIRHSEPRKRPSPSQQHCMHKEMLKKTPHNEAWNPHHYFCSTTVHDIIAITRWRTRYTPHPANEINSTAERMAGVGLICWRAHARSHAHLCRARSVLLLLRPRNKPRCCTALQMLISRS